MTIGIYSRVFKEEHTPYVLELIAQLSKREIPFLIYDEYYKVIKNTCRNKKSVRLKHITTLRKVLTYY
jgi:hypothetical protein